MCTAGAALGDVIGEAQVFLLIKMVAIVIEVILISQNFQFIKVNIVNVNFETVTSYFYYQKISVLPL